MSNEIQRIEEAAAMRGKKKAPRAPAVAQIREPVRLIVTAMKNIGKQETVYDTTTYKYVHTGPDYLRIVARDPNDEANEALRLDLPSPAARAFHVGATVVITVAAEDAE